MKKTCIILSAVLLLAGCGSTSGREEPVKQVTMTVTTADECTSDGEYETFYGVLMDECCSDIDDPAIHETACMFMDGCRESGYGLDIQNEDGSWDFFMFDEKGQQLTWEYLNTTERLDGLYVTVTGSLEDEVIKVISIKES